MGLTDMFSPLSLPDDLVSNFEKKWILKLSEILFSGNGGLILSSFSYSSAKKWQASATPLQRAAAEGHVDIVHQLLKHGADVNHQDSLVSPVVISL